MHFLFRRDKNAQVRIKPVFPGGNRRRKRKEIGKKNLFFSIAPRGCRDANKVLVRRSLVFLFSTSFACVARFAWDYGSNAPQER